MASLRDRLLAAVRILRTELPHADEVPAEEVDALAQAVRRVQAGQRGVYASAQDVLGAMSNAAAIFGADGRVRAANAAFAALHPHASSAGLTALEATRSADVSSAVADAVQGGVRERVVTLPATQQVVGARASSLPRGEALLVLVDLTEQKRVERARRDFVANASHELRTPVAAILGALETLRGGGVALSADAQTFVEMISRHAQRLSELSRDLLDLTRYESGEWKPDLAPVDVGAAARGAIELVRERAAAKSQAVEGRVAEGLRALADRRALEQVLVNLLDNAVKHTPQGSHIAVEARAEGSEVVIAVVDDGPGIEARHLARLFERFYRADEGRARQAGGTGLGLAIVKHLAQAQGGEAGAESGPGGSRFWVRLPLA